MATAVCRIVVDECVGIDVLCAVGHGATQKCRLGVWLGQLYVDAVAGEATLQGEVGMNEGRMPFLMNVKLGEAMVLRVRLFILVDLYLCSAADKDFGYCCCQRLCFDLFLVRGNLVV